MYGQPKSPYHKAYNSEGKFLFIEGNSGIYIVGFLRYTQGKAWEGSENHEEVATFAI
jgi:hypothetical protein